MIKSSLGGPPRFIVGLVPTLAFLTFVAFLSFGAGCSAKSDGAPAGGDASADMSTGPACPAEDDLISDFTMDHGVRPVDGRQGAWYTYADRSAFGTLTPAEGGGITPDTTEGNPSCSRAGSLHVKAVGFMDWGAATGADFMPKVTSDGGIANVKGTYDARRYRGVSFWAKAAGEVKFAMVKFLDPYTDASSVLPLDQTCQYRAMAPDNCSPYIVKFGHGYTGEDATALAEDYPKFVNTKIDTTWRRFEVLFADTKQDRFNPGRKSPGDKLDVSQLVGMAIQINSNRATVPPTPNDFEIWIDDVAFVK